MRRAWSPLVVTILVAVTVPIVAADRAEAATTYSQVALAPLADSSRILNVGPSGHALVRTEDLLPGFEYEVRRFVWHATEGVDYLDSPEENRFTVWDINAGGQMAGSRQETVGGVQRATIWDGGAFIDVGPDPAATGSSWIDRLLDNGRALGYTNSAPAGGSYFVWSPVGGLEIIDHPDYDVVSIGDMNTAGYLTGTVATPSGRRAAIWPPTGEPFLLGGLGTENFAGLINDQGVVAGRFTTGPNTYRSYRWDAAHGMVELAPPQPGNTSLFDLDATGSAAGRLEVGSSTTTIVWSPDGTAVDLGALGTGDTLGWDMNARGSVVGDSEVPSFVSNAFVWNRDEGMTNLGAPGEDSSASWIVDDGRAFGGRTAGQDELGFTLYSATMWQPIVTTVDVHWTGPEYARLAQISAFYGYSVADMPKVSVAALAFIIGLVPSPGPTPLVLDPAGTDTTQTVVWQPDELVFLDRVMQRFALDREDAHRFAVYLLGYLAAIQGH